MTRFLNHADCQIVILTHKMGAGGAVVHRSVFTDELFCDVERALPTIAGWGSKYVDFRGMVNGKGIEFQTDEELHALKKRLDELGLRVGVLQSSLCKANLPDEKRQAAEMQKLEGLIRASDILGCKLARAFNYWQHEEGEPEFGQLCVRPDEMAKVMAMFAPIAKRAREAGLMLAFENCGQTADEVIALVQALGVPGWGLGFDVSNYLALYSQDEAAQNAYLEKCLQHARLLHVKATSILPELQGVKAPWEKVLRAAAAMGVDLPVSMETHNPKGSPLTHEEATRRCFDLIGKAWPSGAPSSVREALKAPVRFRRSYENDPVRFVVVGLGMGRHRCRQLQATSGCKLYGVVDINYERAKAVGEEFQVPYSANIQDFLDDPAVEVMYTVLPTGLHGAVSEQCLRAGKHVLTTKPMDVSADNCRSAMAVARACGRLFAVDFDLRQDEMTLSLKKAVDSGWFGHLLSAHAALHIHRTQAYYDENGAWRGTWRYDGGGAMCNQGVHEVDRLQHLLGMPKRVRAITKTQTHAIEVEDLGYAEWDYGTQLAVRFFSTTSYPMPTWYARIELHGSAGAFIYANGGPEGESVHYGKDGKWSKEAPYPVARAWQQGSDAFASAVRLHTPLVTPPEEALRSRILLDAMYESAAAGSVWVSVSL